MDTHSVQKIFEYSHYFLDMQYLEEIDHIHDEFFGFLVESLPDYDFSGIAVIENRMAISFGVGSTLHPICRKMIIQAQTLIDEDFIAKFEEINLSSRIMLCLNGEINSAVNRRIRMLELNLLKDLEEELYFIQLVLFKFKKSSIVWYYRQRVISKYFEEKGKTKDAIVRRLQIEDKMLDLFFRKYPRNYYAWGYKKYILDEFVVKPEYVDVLQDEYMGVKEYCEKHIHDYCAFHLLNCLIRKLSLQTKGNSLKEDNIVWGNNLLKKYQELYLLEQLDLDHKGIKYHELESLKIFLKTLKKMNDI